MPPPSRFLAASFAVVALAGVAWIVFANLRSDGSWKGYLVAAAILYVAVDFGVSALTGDWPTLSFWGG
jgi:hypothetical protein